MVLSGCTPGAIQPTLAAIQSLDYTCGDGVRDNVPSGLYQWRCTGRAGSQDATIDVDGNDAGVAEIDLTISSFDLSVIRSEFRRIATDVTPLRVSPLIVDALMGWSGEQRATVVGSARIASECDATQCIVEVTSIDGPLGPLHLP
jgi:hypothetical protein